MTKLIQYRTRAASHVTSKNRRTKPIRAMALAKESTMLTEVWKYSSNLLFKVVVSWQMTCENNKRFFFFLTMRSSHRKMTRKWTKIEIFYGQIFTANSCWWMCFWTGVCQRNTSLHQGPVFHAIQIKNSRITVFEAPFSFLSSLFLVNEWNQCNWLL